MSAVLFALLAALMTAVAAATVVLLTYVWLRTRMRRYLAVAVLVAVPYAFALAQGLPFYPATFASSFLAFVAVISADLAWRVRKSWRRMAGGSRAAGA